MFVINKKKIKILLKIQSESVRKEVIGKFHTCEHCNSFIWYYLEKYQNICNNNISNILLFYNIIILY